MSKAKLTPWTDGDVNPVRPGVYEVRIDGSRWFRRWDGRRWHWGHKDRDTAATKEDSTGWPDDWRGLAQEPKP